MYAHADAPYYQNGMEDNMNKHAKQYQGAVPVGGQIVVRTNEVEKPPLPNGYQPSEYDVVAGRGKGSYNRPGNRRFRNIVQRHIPEYLRATTKLDKSMVLGRIIEAVQEQNNGNARFIKYDKMRGWYEIEDDQAREKVGHAIREAIHTSSSSDTDRTPVSLTKKKAKKTSFSDKQSNLLAQQQMIFGKLLGVQDRRHPHHHSLNMNQDQHFMGHESPSDERSAASSSGPSWSRRDSGVTSSISHA